MCVCVCVCVYRMVKLFFSEPVHVANDTGKLFIILIIIGLFI